MNDGQEIYMKATKQPAITGYRNLSQLEIDTLNDLKAKERECLLLVNLLKGTTADQRWVAIGRTHIEEAFMALTRAVAKPRLEKIESETVDFPVWPPKKIVPLDTPVQVNPDGSITVDDPTKIVTAAPARSGE